MKLDEHGKQCPRPVADTKKTLEPCSPGETIKALVDSETAVQNLSKVTAGKGLSTVPEKISNNESSVKIPVSQGITPASGAPDDSDEKPAACLPDSRKRGMAVILSSNLMDHGNPELGKALVKGFVYTLTQQGVLSETILLYNSDAYLSCESSDNLEDLKSMESRGVGILTCGACLNFYGLSEKLQVNSIINMYEAMERMIATKLLVRP